MSPPDIKRSIELDAVTADALWAVRLAMSLARNPEKVGVAAIFTAFNYLSLSATNRWVTLVKIGRTSQRSYRNQMPMN